MSKFHTIIISDLKVVVIRKCKYKYSQPIYEIFQSSPGLISLYNGQGYLFYDNVLNEYLPGFWKIINKETLLVYGTFHIILS